MEKFLGQDVPEDKRWQFLQDNADAIEEIGITYAPHPETQTTKTDHFPAFNKLFRLPEMYLLPTVEIRTG